MTFELILLCAVTALVLGWRLHAEHSPGRAFCGLWALVLVGWEIASLLFTWWINEYTLPPVVLSWSMWAFCLVGVGLNAYLFRYICLNRTGYFLIGGIFLFYMAMGLAVVFELAAFRTNYMAEVFNTIAPWSTLVELFLLLADGDEHRRRIKRFITSDTTDLHGASPNTTYSRLD